MGVGGVLGSIGRQGEARGRGETYCNGVATRAIVAVVVVADGRARGVSGVGVESHRVAGEVSCGKRSGGCEGGRRRTYWRARSIWMRALRRGRDPGRVSGVFCAFVCWRALGGRRTRCRQRHSLRRDAGLGERVRGGAGKRGDRTIRVTLGSVEGRVGEGASAVLLEIVEGGEGYEGGLSRAVSVVVRHGWVVGRAHL